MDEKNYLLEFKQLNADIVYLRYLLRRLSSDGHYWDNDSKTDIELSVQNLIVKVFDRFRLLLSEIPLAQTEACAAAVFENYLKLQNLYLYEPKVFELVENWPVRMKSLLEKRPKLRLLLEQKPL